MEIIRKISFYLCLILILLNCTASVSAVSNYEKFMTEINLKYLNKKYDIYEMEEDNYLSHILNKLEKSVSTEVDFKLYYAESPEFNALYIGDGNIVLFKGLIKRVKDKGQLASVLAHLMAHGTSGHIGQYFENVAGLKLSGWNSDDIVGKDSSDVYEIIQEHAMKLFKKGFSGKVEKEADLTSLKILEQANYDFKSSLDLMKLLDELDVSINLKFLDYPKTRIKYIKKYLREEKNIYFTNTPKKMASKKISTGSQKIYTQGKVLFKDDFQSNDSGWNTDENYKYEYGQYKIISDKENHLFWSYSPYDLSVNNYIVETKMKMNSENGAYGYIFNYKDINNFFYFKVIPYYQVYKIKKQVNDEWVTVVNWTKNEKINNETNIIKLVKINNEFEFYINSNLVDRIKLDNNISNEIAILNSSSEKVPLEVYFDDFIIYKLTEKSR